MIRMVLVFIGTIYIKSIIFLGRRINVIYVVIFIITIWQYLGLINYIINYITQNNDL